MKPGIAVLLEQRGGEIKRASLEALAEAVRQKSAVGGEVCAIVMGHNLDSSLDAVKASGADKLCVFDREDLQHYSSEGYRDCAVHAIRECGVGAVFVAATIQGRDLAAAVAGPVALDAGYAAECTELSVDGGELVAERPVYAGKAVVKVSAATDHFVLGLRPNIFDATLPGGGAAEVMAMTPPFEAGSLGATVTGVAEASKGKKDVAEADVVVAGGRGTGGPEGFAALEELAEVLGGAVGASRAVVDLGWRPHAEQVGQTGKVVSPKLYIAAGISGAIQHLAGMRTSKVIVAINKDKDAPIFKVADFGIVGDLFEVLPALIKEVKALQA